MSKMFSNHCTNPNCQDEFPEPVVSSKGWAYCRPCYIRIYPDAALRRGWVKPDDERIEKHLAIKENKNKAKQIAAYIAKQPTLFDSLDEE